MFKRLIYDIQNNLHQLTTHLSTLIMWHNRFSEDENEAVEAHIPRHRRPKSHDIEIQSPKNPDIEKRRQLTHNIVIPRHFFRGQKATTSRFHG